MHYYQFHIGDYASHTAHLDELEDLAYRRMLDYCYLNEIGLPPTVEEIARLIRMRTHCERIANVLREFFVLHDDGVYRQFRVEQQIADFRGKSDKAKQAARKRWENTDANALPTHSERNANHKPITNNHKPIVEKTTTRGARLSTHFEPDFDFAKQNGIANPAEEYEKFKDYWFSQAGAKGVKLDWQATWRNWCRSAKTFTKTPAFTPPSPAITTPSREAIDPIMAMAIQESARTFKPVTEIYKSMKNKALGVAA